MPTTTTEEYKQLFITTATDHIQLAESLLSQLANSLSNEDAKEFFRHIHSLKGSSSVMGYKEISSACDEIDSLIHPTSDTYQLLPQHIGKISDLLSQTKQFVAALKNQI